MLFTVVTPFVRAMMRTILCTLLIDHSEHSLLDVVYWYTIGVQLYEA